MKFTEKLIKPITETAYLTEENTPRYRPIMRYFYEKHEQAENWLYKEDVYEALQNQIEGYTLEECGRDLDFLVSKLSLTTVQDIENANTLEKFKFKNYRYQMTDYAIEIERMTIRLEELEVKVASLEPRLFERIKIHLKKILHLEENINLNELWSDLTADFENLNYSYQDFLKKFNEPVTEELLQSVAFIEHKNQFINYLRNFIKEYLFHSKQIKIILQDIPEENVVQLMDDLISYQKNIPQLKPNFDFDHLRKVNEGKWISIKKWFIGIGSISEGDRLLEATNQIISKITKYASNLIELHGNMANRKEEYKYLCRLFDQQKNIKEASKLSSAILGVDTVRHFKGTSLLSTNSIIPSLEVEPIVIKLDPVQRGIRFKTERIPIEDKQQEKQKLLEQYLEEEEKKKKILTHFIKNQTLTGKVKLTKEERRYLFTLIEKAKNQKGVEPIFGKTYQIEILPEKCQIFAEDGIFSMNGILLTFGGDKNERYN